MSQTITEKILARASGKQRVSAGDVVFASVDKALIHDVSGIGVAKVFEELESKGFKIDKLWNAERIIVAEDHFIPCPDQKSAENVKLLEKFVKRFRIKKYFRYGLGQYGVCHTLIHEEALVLPGEVLVGGDSHTNTAGALGCFATGLGHTDMAYVLINGKIWFKVPESLLFRFIGNLKEFVMAKDVILSIIKEIGVDGANYKAMEFSGEGIKNIEMDERFTLTNMSTEAGAKNGIIAADERAIIYIKERTNLQFKVYSSDHNANYDQIFDIELDKVEPMVAEPYSPANSKHVRELSNIELDKAYIGSCTGGKLHDLRQVARILKGRKVKIRTEVVPATQSIYIKALKEGLIEIFLQSGALVAPPTCGLCVGAHMGVLGKAERCISATNRNFKGRMGHRESITYLASPLTVAASAVTGKITDPRDLR